MKGGGKTAPPSNPKLAGHAHRNPARPPATGRPASTGIPQASNWPRAGCSIWWWGFGLALATRNSTPTAPATGPRAPSTHMAPRVGPPAPARPPAHGWAQPAPSTPTGGRAVRRSGGTRAPTRPRHGHQVGYWLGGRRHAHGHPTRTWPHGWACQHPAPSTDTHTRQATGSGGGTAKAPARPRAGRTVERG